MARDNAVKVAAQFLVDNQQFTVVLEALKVDAMSTLTQGSLDDAESNLRNYRAVEVLEAAVKVLADG